MPVVLKITFTSGPDSLIRVDNTANNQEWIWMFNRQPSAFAFDPNNDIVLKQATTNPIGIEHNGNEVPERFALKQNFPNPFNPTTRIMFDIPAKSSVELRVYDLAGRLVNIVYTGLIESGKYTVDFDASNISSGVYIYELKALRERGNLLFKDVKKMVVLK
jgi:hypothetical protein